jgi:hypothetical protein
VKTIVYHARDLGLHILKVTGEEALEEFAQRHWLGPRTAKEENIVNSGEK